MSCRVGSRGYLFVAATILVNGLVSVRCPKWRFLRNALRISERLQRPIALAVRCDLPRTALKRLSPSQPGDSHFSI